MSITIDGIDTKVRTVEGTARATPIGMKNLDDRINALGDRGKFAIRTLTTPNYNMIYNIPSEFQSWNFLVIGCSTSWTGNNGNVGFDNNKISVNAKGEQGEGILKFYKSGTTIRGESSGVLYPTRSAIKVLFYTETGY